MFLFIDIFLYIATPAWQRHKAVDVIPLKMQKRSVCERSRVGWEALGSNMLTRSSPGSHGLFFLCGGSTCAIASKDAPPLFLFSAINP